MLGNAGRIIIVTREIAMATSLRKQDRPVIDRAELLRIMDLPLEEFRAARAERTEAERQELNRLFQEENAEAIRSSNEWVEKNGLPLEKHRPF